MATIFSSGILPNQNIFNTEKSGIVNGRRSLVDMLNIIFARNAIVYERSNSISDLSRQTPISEYLIWKQTVGEDIVEALPPIGEWGGVYKVNSIQERNELLLDTDFQQEILNGNKPRVLLDGLNNEDAPQWSVWEAVLPEDIDPNDSDTVEYIIDNPFNIFSVVKSYDYDVDTFSERNLLITSNTPISIGERVLVKGNSSTSNLWTVWKYIGTVSDETDANGFQLVRYQTYNTDDFYSLSDWYADGYDSTKPPTTTYQTISDRNDAENPNPTSKFVKVNDSGDGTWVWTEFVNDAWIVVAREKGTIKLSKTLYSNYDLTNNPPIGLEINQNDISRFYKRDGSWEIKILLDVLRTSSILTDLEKNELFFSLIHNVHTQFDQVPWIFKTSFLNISGYNEPLSQSPVTPIDNTQNLLDYITETKPYRVKTRSFTRALSPPRELANAVVTDFDFPPYYDENTQLYRQLDLNNTKDLAIIKSSTPWKDWYDNYLLEDNPIRKMKIKMLFDRIDHMPIVERNDSYYQGNLISLTNNLSDFIVEVLVNKNRIKIDDDYTLSGTNVLLNSSNSYTEDDLISVIVRQPLTENKEAYRIFNSYSDNYELLNGSTKTTQEKNIPELLNNKPYTHTIEGGDFSDTLYDFEMVPSVTPDDNVNTKDLLYSGIADPQNKDRPEELVISGTTEAVTFYIDSENESGTNKYVISLSVPHDDMFSPKETGDFDVGPLEQIEYDTDYVAAKSLSPTGEEKGNYIIKSNAWEHSRRLGKIGSLLGDVTPTSNSIIISPLNNNITLPKTLDTSDGVETIEPGVIWINGERIEFFTHSIDQGNIVLTNLKRGTHRTPIGKEKYVYNKISGNGSQKTFTINNISSFTGLCISVYETPKYISGEFIITEDYTGNAKNVEKTFNVDYSASISNNTLTIVFNSAPTSGSTIFITFSTDVVHEVGTDVYDGKKLLEHRLDSQFDGETNY